RLLDEAGAARIVLRKAFSQALADPRRSRLHHTAVAPAGGEVLERVEQVRGLLAREDRNVGLRPPMLRVAPLAFGERVVERRGPSPRDRAGGPICELAVLLLRHVRETADEGRHPPDLVVALERRPRRHAGEPDALL